MLLPLVCVSVGVCSYFLRPSVECVSLRDRVSLFVPLWQLADVLLTVSDSVSVFVGL